jgi:hypothetical protein
MGAGPPYTLEYKNSSVTVARFRHCNRGEYEHPVTRILSAAGTERRLRLRLENHVYAVKA